MRESKVKLTQQQIRNQSSEILTTIEIHKSSIREVRASLKALQLACNHLNMKPTTTEALAGKCGDCGYITAGWYCPSSPFKECAYQSQLTEITVLEQTRADTNDPNRKRDCTDRISTYQSFISKLSQLTDIKSE